MLALALARGQGTTREKLAAQLKIGTCRRGPEKRICRMSWKERRKMGCVMSVSGSNQTSGEEMNDKVSSEGSSHTLFLFHPTLTTADVVPT